MHKRKIAFPKLFTICGVLVYLAPPYAAANLLEQNDINSPVNACRSQFGHAIALGDLDGDRFDDLVVAARGTNSSNDAAFIYYSLGNGSFSSPTEINIGRPIGVATGDVNNDGLQDAIISSSFGQICAFYGNAIRLSSSIDCSNADWVYNDAGPFGGDTPSMADVIDVNADGVDDIIVGLPNQDKSYVFYGSSSGLPADLQPDAIIEGQPNLADNSQIVNGIPINYSISGQLGSAVGRDGNLCDATNPFDPCGSQFAIGVPGSDIDLDGSGFISSAETSIGVALVGPRWQFLSGDNVPFAQFGYELGHAGDVNGDGETDLIVSAKATSNAFPKSFVYLGKSEGFAKMDLDYAWAVEETADRQCLNPGLFCRTFGASVASAGDINGDGYGDIAVGDPRYDVRGGRSQAEVGWWGRAYFWFGGPATANDPSGLGANPTPQSADIIIDGKFFTGEFGAAFAAGDLNGDGFTDIAVGDPRGAGFCADSNGEFIFDETGVVFVYLSGFAPPDDDADGTPNSQDNCLLEPNGPLITDAGGNVQLDTDSDGYGNLCDPDFDNNGVVNAADMAYMKSNFFSADRHADLNGDGIVNAADLAILRKLFFGPPGPSGLVP